MRHSLIETLCLIGLAVVFGLNAYADEQRVAGPVHSKAQAIDIANRYAGFVGTGKLREVSLDKVELIRLQDTTTPFLSQLACGEAVWRVRYENVPLVKTEFWLIKRTFELFIDSTSGLLLKAVCANGELDPVDDPAIPVRAS